MINVKITTLLLSTSVLLGLTAGAAVAGPAVTVDFKNLGTVDAVYTAATKNELDTKANAKPAPISRVPAGRNDTYIVQNQQSPDVNFAYIRYVMGGKQCTFLANFVTLPASGGTTTPKWNNTATPSGGATCTIKETSRNQTTHGWSVELTMK